MEIPVEETSMRSRVRSVVLAGTLLAVGSSPAVAQNPNWGFFFVVILQTSVVTAPAGAKSESSLL